MRRARPGVTISGLALLVIGVWLLLSSLGVTSIYFSRGWPVLVILISLSMLAQYASEQPRHDGLLFLGSFGLLAGILMLVFASRIGGISWADFGRYSPLLLIFFGTAFLLVYLASGMRRQALMAPSALFGGAGWLLLPFTLGMQRGTALGQAASYWPLLIIPLAVVLFFRARRAPAQPGGDERGQ